jgi:predicted nucleotidyltransferase
MQINLDNDRNLFDIVAKLKGHFKPEKIYLFGSRANGTASEDSDYDLLLIVKSSDKSPIDRAREARLLLWGRTVSVDIFVYTETEFNDSKNEFSSIAHTVATEGLEL